jgi:molecular chaperone DnaK
MKWSDPFLARAIRYLSFKAVSGESEYVCAEVLGQKYPMREIETLLFRGMKRAAEQYLLKRVRKAVVSVPPAFSAIQCQAMSQAALAAGFRSVSIITDDVAVGYVHQQNMSNQVENIVVCSLGAASLSISFLEISESEVKVKFMKGDAFLGGNVTISLFRTSTTDSQKCC